jgi:hypothetical protein
MSTIVEALDRTEAARRCISQNRGYDKELAREAYEHVVAEELIPALLSTLEDAMADLEARKVERLARHIWKRIEPR